jgi:putative FmdB family regulatory protein
MPIYQYECPSCNHKFELRQKFSDISHVHCPKCKNGAKRLFIPVPIIFKGSGFYVTDSAKKSDIQDTPKEKKEITTPVKETKETTAKETKETPKAEAKKDSPPAKAS